jgi:hypothetical protein
MGSLAVFEACATDTGEVAGYGTTASPDSISWADDPSRLIAGVSTLLIDNITPADVGKTFGVDAAHMPYPDTYWPFSSDGIDATWSVGPSPLEKYMAMADPLRADGAAYWERTRHGRDVPNLLAWWGHCPGWTGAAISNGPIVRPVFAKLAGSAGVVACAPSDPDCTKFEIGDINALMAEIYVDAQSSLIGARCDEAPSNIQRDADGRIVRDGRGCQGLNAGSLLVVLSQYLKKARRPLAIDAQNAYNTDQIWNQPAYSYTVYRFEPLTTSEAANLVAHGTRTGDRTVYAWNAAARGFALLDVGIMWVSELGPNTAYVSGTYSSREMRTVAVIELSADPTSLAARILGGEYIDDPTVSADRLRVPPYVWVAHGAGPEQLSLNVDGSRHNPFVRPSIVAELVRLGQHGEPLPPSQQRWFEVSLPGISPSGSFFVPPRSPAPPSGLDLAR